MAFANGRVTTMGRIELFGTETDMVNVTFSDESGVYLRIMHKDDANSVLSHIEECDNHQDMNWVVVSDDTGRMVGMWNRTDAGFFQMRTNVGI